MQQSQGLQSLEELADARHALAIHGRYGDTTIGHLTPGEMVLPRPIADDPVLKRQLFDAFERHDLNPHQYQVGHFENSINPLTGVPEFGFFKKIGKFLKKAAPVIGKVVGFAIGGPAGAAIGGGIGGAVKEGNLKGANNTEHKTFYGNIGLKSGKWYWEGAASGPLTVKKWTYGVSDIENTKNTQIDGQNYLIAVSSGSPSNATYAYGDAVSIYNDAKKKMVVTQAI